MRAASVEHFGRHRGHQLAVKFEQPEQLVELVGDSYLHSYCTTRGHTLALRLEVWECGTLKVLKDPQGWLGK